MGREQDPLYDYRKANFPPFCRRISVREEDLRLALLFAFPVSKAQISRVGPLFQSIGRVCDAYVRKKKQ
jgi:hypothetical protein